MAAKIIGTLLMLGFAVSYLLLSRRYRRKLAEVGEPVAHWSLRTQYVYRGIVADIISLPWLKDLGMAFVLGALGYFRLWYAAAGLVLMLATFRLVVYFYPFNSKQPEEGFIDAVRKNDLEYMSHYGEDRRTVVPPLVRYVGLLAYGAGAALIAIQIYLHYYGSVS